MKFVGKKVAVQRVALKSTWQNARVYRFNLPVNI